MKSAVKAAIAPAVQNAVAPAVKPAVASTDPAKDAKEKEQNPVFLDSKSRYNNVPVVSIEKIGRNTAYDSLPEEVRDLSGKVFTWWTVREGPFFNEGKAKDKDGKTLRFDSWLCACACEAGTVKRVNGNDLRVARSSGCIECKNRRRFGWPSNAGPATTKKRRRRKAK